MIPEWFKCEFCLWFDMDMDGDRCLGSRDRYVFKDDRCPDWTCKTCWQPWDKDDFDNFGVESFFVNHSECNQVKVSEAKDES